MLTRLVLSIACVFLILAARVNSQEIILDSRSVPKTDAGFLFRWDSVQNQAVFYRDIDDPNVAAGKILGIDGTIVYLYPLRSVPGAKFLDVWATAATPDGGAVLSVIVGYGPRNENPSLKSMLLTFDGGGNMTKLWDVKPYHFHFLAVDSKSEVFAWGDVDDVRASYPMLVKYSSEGKVIGEYLLSSEFKDGEQIIRSANARGENSLSVDGDEVVVWVASTRELFRFSTDGQLRARVALGPALERIETANNTQLEVLTLATGPDHKIFLQTRVRSKDRKQFLGFASANMFADGTHEEFIPADPSAKRLFLGATNDHKMAYQITKNDGTAIISIE